MRVAAISFVVANFFTYEKGLIKRSYTSKDLSAFKILINFLEQVEKM